MEIEKNVCNESVYSEIYSLHAKSVWRFIYYKCGDEDQANDLVQEAFIKLWQNCSKITIEKSKSFLYTVARNTFFNIVAHRKVVLKHQNLYKHAINKETPQFIMEENEFRDKLQNALDNLTEKQRTAFLLNRIEGKKYREIAEILDISIKTVEQRMSNALAALRKEIGNI